jgi:rare lipoprotein A
MIGTILILLLSNEIQAQPYVEIRAGVASYYSNEECSGTTASGEIFDDTKFTCAARFGSFGQRCLVISEDGHMIICRLNDRGPWVRGKNKEYTRTIDLSKAAMKQLHGVGKGLVNVKIYTLARSGT